MNSVYVRTSFPQIFWRSPDTRQVATLGNARLHRNASQGTLSSGGRPQWNEPHGPQAPPGGWPFTEWDAPLARRRRGTRLPGHLVQHHGLHTGRLPPRAAAHAGARRSTPPPS
eukprot:1332915-Lingulodinium_polyedra.AAC.1